MENFDLNNYQSSNSCDDISMKLNNLNTPMNIGQQPFNSGGWFLDSASPREAVPPKDPNQASHAINMRLVNLNTVTNRSRFTL